MALGIRAAESLFGRPLDTVDCVYRGRDLRRKSVPYIETLRPLPGATIEVLWQRPARELVATLRA